MQFLKEIKDKDFPRDATEINNREAARAVLFDENNMIPLLFVSKYNYHKIPGGGIEKGENKLEALKRECFEEVGCEIEVIGKIGEILEFRAKWNLKQISYCYFGKIISKREPDFTENELNQGFKVVWFPLEDAILKLENDKPENYEGKFVQKRDLEFLKQTREII